MSKVVTIHGHTLELDMGPSCPNPGIRRQLDAKGEPYMCTSDLTTWIGIDGDWYRAQCSLRVAWYLKTVLFQLLRLIKAHYNLRLMNS